MILRSISTRPTGSIGPAIVRVVVDAQDRAVFQPDPGRALNLREQHVDLAAQPADFQMPAVERALLDLAAVVIRHDLAAADAAADFDSLAWKRIAQLAAAGDDQIGRPAIKRRGEFAGRHPRAVDDRLVVSGEKSFRVAELADAQRPEIVLEEFPGAVLLERNGGDGALADRFERLVDRRRFAARLPGAVERAAAGEKSGKRGGVIVSRPAFERRPIERLVLRIGEFYRFPHTAARDRGQAETDHERDDEAQAPGCRHGLIVRLRLQPPSSSDRARRHRGRRSTRR